VTPDAQDWPSGGEYIVQVPDPGEPGGSFLAHVSVAFEREHPVSTKLPGLLRDAIAADMTGAPPPLTPDGTRALLRDCVTVVRPGEILVIRLSPDSGMSPGQVREYQEYVDCLMAGCAPGIRALVIVGDGGQILRQEDEMAP
jgi:hypothetical protein